MLNVLTVITERFSDQTLAPADFLVNVVMSHGRNLSSRPELRTMKKAVTQKHNGVTKHFYAFKMFLIWTGQHCKMHSSQNLEARNSKSKFTPNYETWFSPSLVLV